MRDCRGEIKVIMHLGFCVLFTGRQVECSGFIAFINGFTGAFVELAITADQLDLSLGPILLGSGDGATMVLYTTLQANNSNFFMASLTDMASGRKDMVLHKNFIFY